jgi:uncharacterized Zn ribbon protein
MKKIFLNIAVVLIYIVTNTAIAQNCSTYYPLKEGASFEFTSYDKKDKPVAVVTHKMTSVTTKGTATEATVETEIFDDKNTSVATAAYTVTCENGHVAIDFKSLITPEMLTQYQDMEIDISGNDMIIPNDLSVGKAIPDSDVLMIIKMTPIQMKMSMKMLNGKVEKREKITTPAGTFDCYVIVFETEFKMGIKRKGKTRQWLAKDIGIVKTEDYNKKGKVISKSVLTKFSK